MTEKNQNTETRILEAAKEIFIKKGMDGSRMQEIADEAGINKSLLHYYYRSKDKLFEAVFKIAIITFAPKLFKNLNKDLSFFTKIELFVENYISLIKKNPHIPGFIIHELGRNPKGLVGMLQNLNIDLSGIKQQISNEVEAGNIIPIKPEQLIVNIIALCVFPIGAKPIIQYIFFEDNKNEYNKFIEVRKKEVSQFIINAIKTK